MKKLIKELTEQAQELINCGNSKEKAEGYGMITVIEAIVKHKKKRKQFNIQDREAGNVIESGLTEKQANKFLLLFEKNDKAEGIYVENFYEIVEKTN